MLRASLAVALALALSLAAACESPSSEGGVPSEGDAMPAATVEDCDGADVALLDWIRQHDVTYIAFAAAWCVACKEEIGTINTDIVDHFDGKSVGATQILVENQVDEKPPLALCDQWTKQGGGTKYPVYVDTEWQMVDQHFGGAVGDLPVHLVVSRDGIIRLRKSGALPTNIQEVLASWIRNP